MLRVTKSIVSHFLNADTFQKGASLAYYTVFSLFPMLILILTVMSFFFGEQAVSGEIHTQLTVFLDEKTALQIEDIIKEHHQKHNGFITGIIGFVMLLMSASGMFNQLQSAFNNLWNVPPSTKNSILKYLSKNFISLVLLLSFFLIALISNFINQYLVINNLHSINYNLFYWCEHAISFVSLSFAFFLLFKFLSDAKVHWKPALLGALFTSVLFLIGKIIINKYLIHGNKTTVFGSASTLAIIMLWVYYSAQIIFFGASFVKITSEKMGYKIGNSQKTSSESLT